jgi:hypothetical protein
MWLGREVGRVSLCSGEVKDERGCTSAATVSPSVCLACAETTLMLLPCRSSYKMLPWESFGRRMKSDDKTDIEG